MTNSDTIEIRRRDMVDSCPMADEVNRLRGTNEYLLKELEKERAKIETLEITLDGYKGSLVTARASRDAAEEERDHWYDQLTHAKGKIQQLRGALSKAADAMGAGAFEIGCVLDDNS